MRRIFKYLLVLSLAALLLAGLVLAGLLYRRLRRPPAPVIVPRAEETIQIPEGRTSRDIGQYFERLGKWQSEEFLEVAGFPQVDYRQAKDLPPLKDRSAEFDFLADKPKYYGLEGYLFPDTYRIYASSTVPEVIDKMLGNFGQKLTPQLRAEIKAQGKTIYEIVTMASLIEKEAPLDYQQNDNRDARIISGIFWDRLKIGQPLQSDATLSYILNDNQPSHSGKDLEVDSPYNTYRHRGLPPGPICNPGLLAIEAAIYPLSTDYNYFLTPPDKPEVIYARTYEQHLQNKYKYLK
ncbi:MAG: endolytic transglycosylase MltG [Patescibacteria group bacterium]